MTSSPRAYLDIVAFVEDAGLPEESGGEAPVDVQQVRDWVCVLGQAGREQDTLELVR